MVNLITKKQKDVVKKEYIIRLISILFFIPTTLLGVFFLAYVLPYYLALDKKEIVVNQMFDSVINIENKENVGPNILALINRAMSEMKAVEIYNKSSVNSSGYFNKIIESKNKDIKINKLSFSIPAVGQVQLLISGVSESREGLVAYIDDLRFKAGFTSIESPVSNFAKDSNIPFTINIKTTI